MENHLLSRENWLTKPTDRFVLKWIKVHLSARITPHLIGWSWLRPWMISIVGTLFGTGAGVLFALGWGWQAGLVAALGQVIDGVDGQFARLTNQPTKAGALTDSVLDRYSDGAMVIGLSLFCLRLPLPIPSWILVLLGSLALVGSNLISYSTARAETLQIDLGRPTLLSKGTRSTIMVMSAIGSSLWEALPLFALLCLAVYPHVVVANRLLIAYKGNLR